MPSLHDLEEFSTSFQNLGKELETLANLQLPYDKLPLPDHEAAVAITPTQDLDSFAPDQTGSEPSDAPHGTDIFGDMSDFFGGKHDETVPDEAISDDFAVEEPLELGQEEVFPLADDFSPGDDISSPDEGAPEPPASDPKSPLADDFGLPPGLLDNFADEMESSTGEDDSKDAGGFDFGEISDSDAGESLDLPGFDTSEGLGLPDLDTSDDMGLSGFDSGEGTDLPDFDTGDGLDLPGEDAFADAPISDIEDTVSPEDIPDFDVGDGMDLPDFDSTGDGLDLPGEDAFADTPIADTEEAASFEDIPDFDAGDGLDLPDFDASEDVGLPGIDSGDMEEASAPEEFSDFDTGDFSSGEASTDLPDFDSSEDMDLPGFDSGDADGSFDFPMEESSSFTADEIPDQPADDDSFDFGGDAHGFDMDTDLEEVSGDSFDSFSPDSGAMEGDFGAGDGDDFGSMGEFSIPGLDNAFDDPSRHKKTAGKRAADDVEEILLTQEELEQFLTTLSSYPLNLRIACQELIAEKAVVPDQMSRLVRLLVNGAPAGETASLAGRLLDKKITIPKGYEKLTGEALEAEQASFAYVFVHNFLPVLRLFLIISLALFSVGYLSWRYIYRPLRAERIYKIGIERITAGEYSRANDRFFEAYRIHEKKSWFYTYARAFRDARQYTLAEEKYQQLLYYTASKNKRGIPEKAAVLEYADLETNYIGDYQTADSIIRRNILDYFPLDREALLALGDNSLAWGEYEPERLEDARESYARYMERYGRSDPLLERMLKYFIRTDNLEQVLVLQGYFMGSAKRKISAPSLAEMGGYFLDKRLETVRGVPNVYLEYIGGIREILLRAAQLDSLLPETYYHLARYYNYFENLNDERVTLDLAVRVFEYAKEESSKRIGYHINALRRYAEILSGSREFFPAEENLVKGVNLYQEALSRRLLTRSPEFGKLYADLGDLEYFVKDGDMQSALDYYSLGEQSGWAPPEIQYRMGSAHYQLRQWGPALDRLFTAYRDSPPNRRILYALGNVSYMRGNYFAAQGYYDRLIEILEDDRDRLPPIMPTNDEEQLDLVERLMVAHNNLGVTLEALTERTGNNRYRSRAQGLYSDSERAWDVLTRNPTTMIRMRPSPEINAPGINPAYLNVQNSLHPVPGYEPQFFLRIDKDILEPSAWENLATPGYRLSEGIYTGR